MPKTSIDVTSPSITGKFSLLLDLPIEIQIEIIELLQGDWQSRGQRDPHPLKSLRLTCKQLESLCNPVFASYIFISSALDRSDLELYNELASKFAKYLKRVVFIIWRRPGEEELFMESVLTTILEGAVQLRQISLYHCNTDADTGAHNQLLSAVSKLNTLEEVKIWEFAHPLFPLLYDTIEFTFNHRFLNHILDYHSKRLRVLAVCNGTPMLESTFLKLRDTASHLRHLELSRCFTIETQGAFTDPRIWACAGRLEDLRIMRCAIHPATIMRHVGAGVFGPLRTLFIVGCEDDSEDDSGGPREPAAAIWHWTIPPLNRVHVNRFNDQEMDSLKNIHAQKVYISRVWGVRSLCIEAFRKSTTFPEVAELHVENSWDDEDFEELKRSCAMRGLTKVERDLED